MPVYNASRLFKTPKNAKTARMCAPKVPYNTCMSAAKNTKCQWIHGIKREYCRTKKNKKRT